MRLLSGSILLLVALAAQAAGDRSGSRHARAVVLSSSPTAPVAARRCTMVPGGARLVLRVERDTLMPLAGVRAQVLSYSTPTLPGGEAARRAFVDSFSVTAETLMPSARVRVLQLDTASRAVLLSAGITQRQPEVFIQAAPYGADCRTVRWRSREPWVVAGDTGYANATLAPRAQWKAGIPVFVIAQVGSYPFPRQRGELFDRSTVTRLASPEALFRFSEVVAAAQSLPSTTPSRDRVFSSRLVEWAAANARDAEFEPIRTQLRRDVLRADMRVIEEQLSRVRGRYRVTMEAGDTIAQWHFITGDRPYYAWSEVENVRSSAEIVASPHVAGYQLGGYASRTFDSLPATSPRGAAIREAHLVWLAVGDRPSAPGNDTTTTVRGELMFRLSAAPAALWPALERFVLSDSSGATARLATVLGREPRDVQQPSIPLTVRIGRDGLITADTTIMRAGHRLRVRLERIDTVSVVRPF